MKSVIMMKGLPGSGKSKWAHENCDAETVRVNKDDIRAMMGGDFSKSKENITLNVRDALVREALSKNKRVIVDDTNFNPIHEETLRSIAKEYDARFIVHYIDTPVDECIKRDAKRANPVGRDVIMDMYRKYVKQVPKESLFDESLPYAIIVDVDGTLAHMIDRSPYDYSKVDTDIVDIRIRGIVRIHTNSGCKVIIVSGRKDECYEQTRQWLHNHGVPFDELHMRKVDDNRADYIVKKEIYDEHIKDKYNILFVLDDRDQVVRMWREEGLKCLQVAEGNF
ncbi:MAG: AAA family ATPase [Weeksellaceae bacterium]